VYTSVSCLYLEATKTDNYKKTTKKLQITLTAYNVNDNITTIQMTNLTCDYKKTTIYMTFQA